MKPPVEPDWAALEIAHKKLAISIPLDEMLKNDAFKRILRIVAYKHIKRRARFDTKKAAAHDCD